MEKRSGWWQVLLRNCFSGFSLTERHHNKGIVVYKALGSLSNYDDNENVKKQLVLWAKQLLCTCITLFWNISMTFTARLRRETSQCDVLRRTWTCYDKFSLLYLNMDKALKNSTPGKVAYIWRIERFQIDAIKFERTQIDFLVMFSLPSSSLLAKLPFYS